MEADAVFTAIQALGNVEFGGHGWNAFGDHNTRSLLWCLCGSRYGPRALQRREIERTKAAFRERLGVEVTVWRGHSYYADENTYPLLAEAGIRVVSDHVAAEMRVGELLPGLWSVPINTTPDHDSVLHGSVTQPAVDRATLIMRALRELQFDPALSFRDRLAVVVRRVCRHGIDISVLDHSGERMYAVKKMKLLEPRAWEADLRRQIEERIATAGFATLLLHPVCMAALDDLDTFRRLVTLCRSIGTGYISEAPRTAERLLSGARTSATV